MKFSVTFGGVVNAKNGILGVGGQDPQMVSEPV